MAFRSMPERRPPLGARCASTCDSQLVSTEVLPCSPAKPAPERGVHPARSFHGLTCNPERAANGLLFYPLCGCRCSALGNFPRADRPVFFHSLGSGEDELQGAEVILFCSHA